MHSVSHSWRVNSAFVLLIGLIVAKPPRIVATDLPIRGGGCSAPLNGTVEAPGIFWVDEVDNVYLQDHVLIVCPQPILLYLHSGWAIDSKQALIMAQQLGASLARLQRELGHAAAECTDADLGTKAVCEAAGEEWAQYRVPIFGIRHSNWMPKSEQFKQLWRNSGLPPHFTKYRAVLLVLLNGVFHRVVLNIAREYSVDCLAQLLGRAVGWPVPFREGTCGTKKDLERELETWVGASEQGWHRKLVVEEL